MKNQYFGDVNDYLKYGLLRSFAHVGWRIGMCWMLTPDDSSGQGGKISYLDQDRKWRHLDPFLFDTLKRTVGAGAPRCISIAYAESFIPQARFFAEHVPDAKDAREGWLNRALTDLSGSDLLFFDPDIGFEIKSSPSAKISSAKHLYWGEVKRAWDEASAILTFQFFARHKRDVFSNRLGTRLHRELSRAIVTPIRTANVLFLLACRPEHETRAEAALELVRLTWKERIHIDPPVR